MLFLVPGFAEVDEFVPLPGLPDVSGTDVEQPDSRGPRIQKLPVAGQDRPLRPASMRVRPGPEEAVVAVEREPADVALGGGIPVFEVF